MASITDCVSEGLKYPLKDIKKLLIFGVLFAVLNVLHISRDYVSFDIIRKAVLNESTNFISHISPANTIIILFLLIVSVIIIVAVLGYEYEVINSSIKKNETLPEFSDVKRLLNNGLNTFITYIVYFAIPTILMIAGFFLSIKYSYGIVLLIISAVTFIIAYFLHIMALNNMVAYESLKKAFDLGDITSKISNLGWLKYIGTIIFTLIIFGIIMAVAGILLSIITALISVLTDQIIIVSCVVGIIEGLTLSSYTGIFYSRVMGSIYRESIKW